MSLIRPCLQGVIWVYTIYLLVVMGKFMHLVEGDGGGGESGMNDEDVG